MNRSRMLFVGLVPMGLLLLGGVLARGAQKSGTSPTVPIDEQGYRAIARPFLDAYCVSCHGETKPKGNFRADAALKPDFADASTKAKWAEVVRALNSHTMPPPAAKQPAPAEVAKAVDWISEQTRKAEQAKRDRAPILRRITRDEYKNTIRDLTGVDYDVSGFPADPPAGGFDNNAQALTVSPLHIELYTASARQILDRALFDLNQPRPPHIKWHFVPKVVPIDSRRVKLDEANTHAIVNGGNNRADGDWIILHTDGWDRNVDSRDFRMPVEGTYTVRLHAACRIPSRDEVAASAEKILAKRRDQQAKENPKGLKWIEESYQNDLKHFRTDSRYSYGPPRIKLIQQLGSQPRTVGEFDVDAPLSAPKTYEVNVPFTTESAGVTFSNVYNVPRSLENFWMKGRDEFARPDCYIDWFEIEGPNYDAWPPTSHTRILFDSPLRQTNERAYAREVLARFMRKAYRRPVIAGEVEKKLALYDNARKDQPFLEAIKAPLTAILASPNFLFLVEPTSGKLNDHELAARLSYFLWGTTPDVELSALADGGKLRSPDQLSRQIDRMLESPRSQVFVRRFTDQWLGLGQVGANPPAENLYGEYDRHYETSIIGESEAFLSEILHHDLNVDNLVRSDFVVVNERLARAYGIPGVRGDQFRKVKVPPGVHRGGIPTQASILTITSNGTRTSPVRRGAWVMRTLLDADPGLPVADAGEIAAKVPGIEKATVRKRLEIHRSRPQCARCHSQIDPWGFALENFNAAGTWREKEGFGYEGRVEENDPFVDASSTLANGTRIVGVDGLQQAILAQPDAFLECLTTKLFTFALNRELGVGDRRTVKAAVAYCKQHGRTMRSLIHYIVASEPFTTK